MTDSQHPIRVWRHAQEPRVSLQELADKVGCAKGYLSRVETGGENLSPELAKKISDHTDIPMRVLCPGLAKLFVDEAAE